MTKTALRLTSLSFFSFLILTGQSQAAEASLFHRDSTIKIDQKNQAKPDEWELNIFLSQNIKGNTETCGCSVLPAGGIHRRWKFVKKRKELPNTLFLDAGNTLFPWNEKLFREQAKMGYAAYNVGSEDLKVKDWIATAKKFSVPFISTNLSQKNAPWAPYKDLFGKGSEPKVRILGLVDPEAAPSGIDAESSVSALKKHSIEGINLVLSEENYTNNSLLAARVEQPTIFLGTKSPVSFTNVEEIGKNALLFSGPHYTQEFGHLRLFIHQKTREIRFAHKLELMNSQWD